MATIAETLNEIQKIQEEFKTISDPGEFVTDLMNFTTIIFFDYISHAALEEVKNNEELNQSEIVKKYFELRSTNGIFHEHLRIHGIGQLSNIWTTYEKYIRSKAANCEINSISKIFRQLVSEKSLSNKNKILQEFVAIRYTRNSLHNGGIHHPKHNSFIGKIRGKFYEFKPSEQVKPIRTMDIVDTIWSHYKEFEAIQ